MRKRGIDSIHISVRYISNWEISFALTVLRFHEGRVGTVMGHPSHSACATILQRFTSSFECSGARCVLQHRSPIVDELLIKRL